MGKTIYTVSIELEDDGGGSMRISQPKYIEGNITDVEKYYIGKELEKFGRELARSVSRVADVNGNDGKLIQIILNSLINVIYNRIQDYIKRSNVDMAGGYLKLYKKQHIIRIQEGAGVSLRYYCGLATALVNIKTKKIIFDLLGKDKDSKRVFITQEEYDTLNEILQADDTSFLDKYLTEVYETIDKLPKNN